MALATTLAVPSEMTIRTAIAICIVILTITLGGILAAWLFCRLTPTRRRDVIELVRAVRRGADRLP
jgi:hypothetical protein